MALSVVDLYAKVLPRTNCGQCGQPTCLAFASMVVAEQYPLSGCPHLDAQTLARCQKELDAQYAAGKWTRKDPAQQALQWARQRAASMDMADLAERTGGRLVQAPDGSLALRLPYFNTSVTVFADRIETAGAEPLSLWEQVFVYNHLAQGGRRPPTGRWVGFESLPNTVSKVKTMNAHVRKPLARHFTGRMDALGQAAGKMGGQILGHQGHGADLAVKLTPLPRLPLLLLYWEADETEGLESSATILLDETVAEHLDIESILFLCQHTAETLIETDPQAA